MTSILVLVLQSFPKFSISYSVFFTQLSVFCTKITNGLVTSLILVYNDIIYVGFFIDALH